MKALSQHRGSDQNIKDFIERQHTRDTAAKASFISYVEGFHAADTHLMSQEALVESEQTDGEGLNDSQLFRPLQRYDLILQKIFESINHLDCIKLGTTLKKINWEKGKVSLSCENTSTKEPIFYACEKLVMAIPLGVLKSSNIEWNQQPKDLKKTLNFLEMGHVQKLILKFRSRFLGGSHKETAVIFSFHSRQLFSDVVDLSSS